MTTIIIVDDEEKILVPLEQMLSGEGYVVKAFSSSKEAETYLKTQTADLAVFDIKMPELDGFSLLKSVRVHRPSEKFRRASESARPLGRADSSSEQTPLVIPLF